MRKDKLTNKEKPRILAVDDDKIMQLTLENILCGTAKVFKVAGSGKEAINELKKGDYNFVISDINMPDMSGYDLAKQIKKHAQKTNKIIWVYAFTGSQKSDIEDKCKNAGFDGILIKGLSSDNIEQTLKKHFG